MYSKMFCPKGPFQEPVSGRGRSGLGAGKKQKYIYIYIIYIKLINMARHLIVDTIQSASTAMWCTGFECWSRPGETHFQIPAQHETQWMTLSKSGVVMRINNR